MKASGETHPKRGRQGRGLLGYLHPHVKRNQLLGLLQKIGHNAESIESILEYAVEL